ncbi:unnamed protein product [Clonostachys rhizophaga]|uniref:Macro domain-containing protein n=1 Tax=Clonostachys rhizophaga TaxID=160324 RepID=A0A9N9YIW4_9HYPO|nr:unnamed protein product [Clonostachys rhizophaga]
MSFSLNLGGFKVPQFRVFDHSHEKELPPPPSQHLHPHHPPHPPHHQHQQHHNHPKHQHHNHQKQQSHSRHRQQPSKGFIYDPDGFEDSGVFSDLEELHNSSRASPFYLQDDELSDNSSLFEDSSLLDDTFIFSHRPKMATKSLADILTVTQLYAVSELKAAATASRYSASRSINDRVGLTKGDITRLSLDAIVNAANTTLLGGGGVDGAIHRAAGPELLEECEALQGCRTGQAKITEGYRLPAKHVIHTVGPVYNVLDPKHSARLLRSCYEESLKLAVREGIKTIGFSGISTGVYGYPSRDAAEVACDTVRRLLAAEASSLTRVVFVAFDEKDMAAYREAIPKYFPDTPAPEASSH